MTEKAAAVMNGGDFRVGEVASPDPLSCKQSHLPNMNGATRTLSPLIKPQISIEHVDPDLVLPNSPPSLFCLPTVSSPPLDPASSSSNAGRQVSKIYVPINDSLSSQEAHGTLSSPQVSPKSVKSLSLPSGVILQDGHSNSSSSCDTPDSDSSTTNSPLVQRYRGYQVKVKDGRDMRRGMGEGGEGGRRGRLASMDSEIGSSSDEVSSDEVRSLGTPPITGKFFKSSSIDAPHEEEHDDDVFQDGELDICTHADGKLVDWAFNVFVPACRTMLFHCAEETVDAKQIQLDLRNLSNLIGFFCNEHQRISTLMRPHKRLKQSRSASNFSKLEVVDDKMTAANLNSARTSISSNSSYDASDSLAERSYAVKVLRGISASLIAPLLKEAIQGFSLELHKSLVVAIQKISWKVEACLSFTNCTPEGVDIDIHGKIFDSEHSQRVSNMMIKTLPPEEPRLQMAAPGGRHASLSAAIAPRTSPPEHPLETSSSPSPVSEKKFHRETNRPGGIVFEANEPLSAGLHELTQGEVSHYRIHTHTQYCMHYV